MHALTGWAYPCYASFYRICFVGQPDLLRVRTYVYNVCDDSTLTVTRTAQSLRLWFYDDCRDLYIVYVNRGMQAGYFGIILFMFTEFWKSFFKVKFSQEIHRNWQFSCKLAAVRHGQCSAPLLPSTVGTVTVCEVRWAELSYYRVDSTTFWNCSYCPYISI